MIILLVPELEALLAEAGRQPTIVSRLIARGRSRALPQDGFLAELVTEQAVAAAAIARRHDRPDDAEGWWAFADPVRLRPDLSAVWIQPHAFQSEHDAAVSDLRDLLAEDGLRFELATPERGYLKLPGPPEAEFTPPWAIAGRSMEQVLPRGREGPLWTRRLNECQVLLHQLSREDPAVPSGLWFWGPGPLPRERPEARISHLIGEGEGLRELAAWLDLSYSPEERGTPDASLRLWSPSPGSDADQALLQLADLIRPLWRRLRLGRFDALELATRRQVWRLRPADAWRFWKQASR